MLSILTTLLDISSAGALASATPAPDGVCAALSAQGHSGAASVLAVRASNVASGSIASLLTPPSDGSNFVQLEQLLADEFVELVCSAATHFAATAVLVRFPAAAASEPFEVAIIARSPAGAVHNIATVSSASQSHCVKLQKAIPLSSVKLVKKQSDAPFRLCALDVAGALCYGAGEGEGSFKLLSSLFSSVMLPSPNSPPPFAGSAVSICRSFLTFFETKLASTNPPSLSSDESALLQHLLGTLAAASPDSQFAFAPPPFHPHSRDSTLGAVARLIPPLQQVTASPTSSVSADAGLSDATNVASTTVETTHPYGNNMNDVQDVHIAPAQCPLPLLPFLTPPGISASPSRLSVTPSNAATFSRFPRAFPATSTTPPRQVLVNGKVILGPVSGPPDRWPKTDLLIAGNKCSFKFVSDGSVVEWGYRAVVVGCTVCGGGAWGRGLTPRHG